MKTDLALRNLLHARARTLAAICGIAFVVVLVFMQWGFFRALERSATMIYDALDFDLCLRSADYLRLSDPGRIPYRRLYEALSVPGIASARPLWVGLRLWRSPQDGQKRPILVMGVDPEQQIFRDPEIAGQVRQRLRLAHHALIDQHTRSEFGPVDGRRFGQADLRIVDRYEVSGKSIELVGIFRLGAGFTANGSMIVSSRGFERLSGVPTQSSIQLGLLRLHSGASAETVQQQLAAILPPDVVVLQRNEVLQEERDLWVRRTSYGLVFQLGIVVALSVGTAVVYQILSGDITALLPEYATLIAMGYTHSRLLHIVIRQGVWLALFGYVPGILLTFVLYELTRQGAQVPMRLEFVDAAFVATLTFGMCITSAGTAALRLYQADPASLY